MNASSTDTTVSAAQTALCFMRAFWDGNLADAEEYLTADATWVFQPSMPYVAEDGPVWPAREAMRRIVADLFGAFDDASPFKVTVTNSFGDATQAVLEYRAEGRVIGGEPYTSRYAACFTVRDAKVAEVRPYNDTKHMFAMLGGEPRKVIGLG